MGGRLQFRPFRVESRIVSFWRFTPRYRTYQVFRNGRMVRAISPAISIRRIHCKALSS